MELGIKKKVIKKLKLHNFDKDNGVGVLALLENSNDVIDSYEKMYNYLDKENLTRNDIFEYAFSLSNIKKIKMQ